METLLRRHFLRIGNNANLFLEITLNKDIGDSINIAHIIFNFAAQMFQLQWLENHQKWRR